MQHLDDRARSLPGRAAHRQAVFSGRAASPAPSGPLSLHGRFHQLDTRTVLAQRAHADRLLPR